jgi:hypothetical protein
MTGIFRIPVRRFQKRPFFAPKSGGPIWDIDHEEGDFSEYTASSTDGGRLSVTAQAALVGTNYGLSVFVNSQTLIYAYAVLGTASTTGVLRVRAYIDPNGVDIEAGASVTFLYLVNSSTTETITSMQLVREGDDSSYALVGVILDDAAGANHSQHSLIDDDTHMLEIEIQRATNDTASNGQMRMWVDNVLFETITGIDNWDRFDDLYMVVAGFLSPTDNILGTYYVDEIIVNTNGAEIGPLGGVPYVITASDGVTVGESVVVVSSTHAVSGTESVTVGESAIVAVSNAAIGETDGVTVGESSLAAISTALINVSDDTTVSDSVTVSVTAPPPASVNISDGVTVGESSLASIGAALINVSDDTTVSDSATVSVTTATPANVNVSDGVTVGELSDTLLSTAQVDVTDNTAVGDLPNVILPTVGTSYIAITEGVTVGESVSFIISDLAISVSDGSTVGESVSGGIILAVATTDNVTVADAASLSIGSASVNVTDAVTVGESHALAIGDITITISDGATIGENIGVSVVALDEINVSVTDGITVGESHTASMSTMTITISDGVTVSDSIGVSVTALGEINVSVTDGITVGDAVTVAALFLGGINVVDNVTLGEFRFVSQGGAPSLTKSMFKGMWLGMRRKM